LSVVIWDLAEMIVPYDFASTARFTSFINTTTSASAGNLRRLGGPLPMPDHRSAGNDWLVACSVNSKLFFRGFRGLIKV